MAEMVRASSVDHLGDYTGITDQGQFDRLTVLQDAPSSDLSARVYSAEELIPQEEIANIVSTVTTWPPSPREAAVRPGEIQDTAIPASAGVNLPANIVERLASFLGTTPSAISAALNSAVTNRIADASSGSTSIAPTVTAATPGVVSPSVPGHGGGTPPTTSGGDPIPTPPPPTSGSPTPDPAPRPGNPTPPVTGGDPTPPNDPGNPPAPPAPPSPPVDGPQPGGDPKPGNDPQPGNDPKPGHDPQPGHDPKPGHDPQPGHGLLNITQN